MMQHGTTLQNLVMLADGLGAHFGKNCEIIIHDLRTDDLEHTILHIVNPEISGRRVGDGPSGMVLKSIQVLKAGKKINDHLCYLTRSKDGHVLKSSTMFLRGKDGRYRYLFGINFDITNLVNIEEGIHSLVALEETPAQEQTHGAIPVTVNDLLDTLIEQSVSLIGKQPAVMTKEEKIRAFRYLNDAGAFLITRSGDKVAAAFGVSKYTLYSYIDINK